MRGVVISLFLVLLLASFASASFSCSDNNPISEDNGELNIGERENINGIYLGLIMADETSVFNRWSVELLIDGQLATLINETPISKEFSDGTDYSISIVSSTQSEATIKIGDSNKTIEEGDSDSIGSFEVFVISADGSYPGTADVDVIIGKSKLSLSNKDSLAEIVPYNGKKYGVELFSASDESALIKVFKCNNASAEIIEIVDETPDINSGNGTANNFSSQNSIINETINNTQVNITNVTTNNSDNRTEGFVEEKSNKLMKFIIFSSIALIVIIFLFFWVRIIKNRGE